MPYDPGPLKRMCEKWPDKQLTMKIQVTNEITRRALSRRPL